MHKIYFIIENARLHNWSIKQVLRHRVSAKRKRDASRPYEGWWSTDSNTQVRIEFKEKRIK